MSKPSTSSYERRAREYPCRRCLKRHEKWECTPEKPSDRFLVLRWLILIVLTLGVVCLVWGWAREPEKVEAAPIVGDAEICKDALTWYLRGNPEIAQYCTDLMNRGL